MPIFNIYLRCVVYCLKNQAAVSRLEKFLAKLHTIKLYGLNRS